MISGKKRVTAIRSEKELDTAASELCELLSLGRAFSLDEDLRYQYLTDAIEAYEKVHHPIPEPSQAAVLEHLLEAKGSTPAKLAKATGVAKHAIAAIMDGERNMLAEEAATFARFFHVEESVFECNEMHLRTAGRSVRPD